MLDMIDLEDSLRVRLGRLRPRISAINESGGGDLFMEDKLCLLTRSSLLLNLGNSGIDLENCSWIILNMLTESPGFDGPAGVILVIGGGLPSEAESEGEL